jgi:hypothetical protein
MKPYLECDGCLLLGNEDDLLEIAHNLEALGKKVWHPAYRGSNRYASSPQGPSLSPTGDYCGIAPVSVELGKEALPTLSR